MITISKKVEYSLELISYLAKNEGKMVSLNEASKRLVLPYRFLGQLAIDLKQAGIVESKEGKTGGYFLGKGWQQKSFYDLLESLGENKHMVKCLGDNECLRAAKCGMRGMFNRIENLMVKELKQIKLNEV